MIHFIEDDRSRISALKVLYSENFDARDFALLTALRGKSPEVGLFALGSGAGELKKEGIKMYSWESLG